MLSIRSLTKSFGRQSVLQALDLEVRAGRVTAIIGPNGAGKTTLIKSVLGLTRPDGGEIRLDGERVAGDAYRARIGYMPQIARFPENLTGAELVAMLTDLRGADADALDVELVERWQLAPQLAKPLRALSGGTRQKVNAVLAFLFRPELLILDEATAGLDPVASGILKDKILAERARGRTFVVTSHIMSELEELADDVAFLVDGQVGFAGPVDDLLRRTRQATLERAVAELMLQRERANANPNGNPSASAKASAEAAA
jgi:Cu-processing system ATP-binding protein